MVLLAVLSVLGSGCASSWQFADRPVTPANVMANLPAAESATGSASKGSADRFYSVLPQPVPTVAQKGASKDQPSTTRFFDSGPLTVEHLPPVANNYIDDIQHSQSLDNASELAILTPDECSCADAWWKFHPPLRRQLCDVLGDHANYYSRRNLSLLAVGVGIAACIANTQFDETLRRNYQEDIRDMNTDEVAEAFHAPEVLGNGAITIPVFCGAALVGSWLDDYPVGHVSNEWGHRCLRTILVGGPPMLAMQVITGASRPGETDEDSRWTPFHDNNGVSGHSFMGAIPFINAAKMTDNPYWKTAFYAGSTLAAFSRINDDDHYASQALLGWWMAYVAATAVDDTQQGNLKIVPMPVADGLGMGVEYRR